MTDIFNLEAEISRVRRRNLLKGQEEIVILGDGIGTQKLEDGLQRLWCRWPGNVDANGNDGIGLPFTVLAGSTNYLCERNQQVRIVWKNGDYEIVGPDPVHMAATGRSMILLNPHKAENNFHTQAQVLTLLPRPVGGMLISVQAWVAVLDDGTYIEYVGSSADSGAVSQHIDMSPYVPTDPDTQCYAVPVFNVSEYKLGNEPLQVVTSTPVDIAVDLTPADIEAALAMMADTTCKPIWAYRLAYGDTVIRGHAFDRDLRTGTPGPLVIPGNFITGNMIVADTITGDKLSDGALTLPKAAATWLHTATSAPTITDDSGDGYAIGTRWIDTATDKEYVCTDASVGAAVWVETTASGASAPFVDSTALVKGSADATKQLRFEVDGFTTGVTRVIAPPDYDGTMATLAGSETLASKILTQLVLLLGGFKATIVHAFTADHTVTIPGDADVTLVGEGTTQTLSLKTLITPIIASFVNAQHNHQSAAGGGQLTDAALSAAVSIAKGGTGQTTKTDAFDALSPTTTAGDTIYYNGTDNVRLAKGAAYQYYRMNAADTAPEWADAITLIDVTWGENGMSTTPPRCVYLDTAANTWKKAGTGLALSRYVGFVLDPGASGNSGTAGKVITKGLLGGFSGLTTGAPVYADASTGNITQTKPILSLNQSKTIIELGWAVTATAIMVSPRALEYAAYYNIGPTGTWTITHADDPTIYNRRTEARVSSNDISVIEFATGSNNTLNLKGQAGTTSSYTVDGAGATTIYIGTNTNARRLAQSITPTVGGLLSVFSVSFAANVGSPTSTMGWSLQTDSGSDAPSGTVITSGTFTPTASATNNITVNAMVQANVKIWFVLQTTVVQTSPNYWQVNFNASGSYTGGSFKQDTATGTGAYPGTWAGGGGTQDLRSSFTILTVTSIAQGISHSANASLEYVDINLKRTGTFTTETLKIELYTSSGGQPNTLVTNGASNTVLASSVGTSAGLIRFTWASLPAMTASTQYHLVLTSTATAGASNFIEWSTDTAGTYTGGTSSGLTSGGWANAVAAADAYFVLYALGTAYDQKLDTGALNTGANPVGNASIGVRYDDNAGANATTNTTFVNQIGSSQNLTLIVWIDTF